MFTLELYDRKGVKLNLGDIVKVSNRYAFGFYAEVKYLEDEEIITPFHTFTFHSFEKVNEIPKEAIRADEERYKVWYVPDPNKEADKEAELFKKYLCEWRDCENLLEKRIFRIKIENKKQLQLF